MAIGKRVTVATIAGLAFGFVCYGFASSGPHPIVWPVVMMMILSRTLIGFAIGISRINLGHWALHGLVMGFIFSVPLSFGNFMGAGGDMTPTTLFILTIVMGMIYGVLIELITTKLFKAPMDQKATPAPAVA